MFIVNNLSTCRKMDALAHLGCCEGVPQKGWLRNDRHLFLTVLGAGMSKIKADLVSGENTLPSSQMDFSCVLT